jgi:uncharacterized protein (TIGR02147 family)
MDRPAVYDYSDFRAYLNDMFSYRKQAAAHFSHRLFSTKAGFASPNFLKLVIDGQRNLTNSSIAKVAKGFGLSKKEREFFENLVFMNQAATHEEKNHYYRKMIAVAGSKSILTIDKDQYEYFSKWYYPVVREIVGLNGGRTDPQAIAACLNPKISTKEAQSALRLLERLDLVQQEASGCWRQCQRDITTGAEVKSVAVANYHKEMMRLAAEAIDRHKAPQRDISALTLSIRRESLPELKARLVALRRELLESAGAEEKPEIVVQINIQMFPLTI